MDNSMMPDISKDLVNSGDSSVVVQQCGGRADNEKPSRKSNHKLRGRMAAAAYEKANKNADNASNNSLPSNNNAPAAEQTSIEDALKSEINYNMPMKTPVSILQELLSRRGITPSYELVQIEGAIHEPTFRYRVSFSDKDAMGAGKSKKEAKHAAAKTLIDKLTGVPYVEMQLSNLAINGTGGGELNENESSSFEDKVLGNPIGWLQELCMARRWPPPTYETEMEVGLPHERQFTIACVVLKYREIGQGKSKKIAKRLAAHKMWVRLHDTTALDQHQIDQLANEDGTEEINRVTNILNRYTDLKDAHIPTITNEHSYVISQFMKTLKSTYGKNMAQLQSICLNDKSVHYVQLLKDIATENQFDVTYVSIDEKTYSGRYQCLLQLSTLPVAVCQGCGATVSDAQSNAARNALEYLKIMTKKKPRSKGNATSATGTG